MDILYVAAIIGIIVTIVTNTITALTLGSMSFTTFFGQLKLDWNEPPATALFRAPDRKVTQTAVTLLLFGITIPVILVYLKPDILDDRIIQALGTVCILIPLAIFGLTRFAITSLEIDFTEALMNVANWSVLYFTNPTKLVIDDSDAEKTEKTISAFQQAHTKDPYLVFDIQRANIALALLYAMKNNPGKMDTMLSRYKTYFENISRYRQQEYRHRMGIMFVYFLQGHTLRKNNEMTPEAWKKYMSALAYRMNDNMLANDDTRFIVKQLMDDFYKPKI